MFFIKIFQQHGIAFHGIPAGNTGIFHTIEELFVKFEIPVLFYFEVIIVQVINRNKRTDHLALVELGFIFREPVLAGKDEKQTGKY